MSDEWTPQVIPGLFTVGTTLTGDSRGFFHKILSGRPEKTAPLLIDEIYWSTSEQGVARGMHLQIPPFHGRKLVFATEGRVQDLFFDLRV
jgi:dTDP-4-dehydrorhamnose 3,5-epimerase